MRPQTQPRRHATNNAIPATTATMPGIRKAIRQEKWSIMTPTNTGATELPALPKTPLMPRLMPCLRAEATIQAMPTGW